MEHTRLSKLAHIADLTIGSIWLLLSLHSGLGNWLINPFLLSYPLLRIWISFLMYRRSKLVIAPIVMLSLMCLCLLCGRTIGYETFVMPYVNLFKSIFALFGVTFANNADYRDMLAEVYECTLPVTLFSLVWVILIPWGMYLYRLFRKELQPCSFGVWKSIGLCAYIFGVMLVDSVIVSVTYRSIIALVLLVPMFMFIPLIFNRGRIKGLFSRGEVAFMLMLAIIMVGYACGIELQLKSSLIVCVLPALCFALVNWLFSRETTYKDILLIVLASVIFWCAQYTTDMMRLMFLFGSLVLTAVPMIRFAIDTGKRWTSAGVYFMVAFIMPILSIGYNPYSVLEAKRLWHFDRYYGAPNGLLCVKNDSYIGLRDRYGVILPIEYHRIELLTPSKPYCKVKRDDKWQIYDIERHEFVSDECFDDVVSCDNFTYQLKSDSGDKYLVMPRFYNRYDRIQPAIISSEIPVNNDSNAENS